MPGNSVLGIVLECFCLFLAWCTSRNSNASCEYDVNIEQEVLVKHKHKYKYKLELNYLQYKLKLYYLQGGKYRYKHKDMKDLEQKLDEAQVRQQGITFMNILV